MSRKQLSRRAFLRLLGGGLAALAAGEHLVLARKPPARDIRLRESILALLAGRDLGFDLRCVDPIDATEYLRIAHNAGRLYPVASAFKVLVVLYYLWNTPRDEWQTGEGSPAYSVAVYSSNTLTGSLLQQVGQRFDFFGNDIQKFNDFLIYVLGMENGLHSWNWPDSPTEEQTDSRFRPSEERFVEVYGLRYRMENLFTAADLARVYAMLINPDAYLDGVDIQYDAIAMTRQLFAIPATNYLSPIERAFPQGYTGKDGTLPASDSAIGRVIVDAGIVEVGQSTYIISYMGAGEGEYFAIGFLRQVARLLDAYEGLLL